MRLAILGTGKMGTAIAEGLVKARAWRAEDIVGVDTAPPAAEAFRKSTGAACVASCAEVNPAADVVLLSVKPQVAASVLPPVAEYCRDRLVVSIMAGICLSRLNHWLDRARVVRVMPNTPLTVGKGAAVFTCGSTVTAKDREVVQRVFGAAGIVMEMSEDKMDAVTALSGSGPAYVFELIQAMADAGSALGLPPDAALKLTVQTVAGAAEMVACGMGSPEALRKAVTSPGGTTAAALDVLEHAEFRDLVRRTVQAARDRSVELGK